MSNGNGPQSLGGTDGIWRALLDFATRVGSTDLVNQTQSTYHQMSQQDREFLANAMASYMRESDPVRQLKENLDILSNLEFGNPNEEQKTGGIAALEKIIDLCCALDTATDFHKLGGFRIFVPLLASSTSEFRWSAAELIAELAQNHPYCQEALGKANVLGVLLSLMHSDPVDTVRTKALLAISCLIRNNDQLQQEFVNLDGFRYLLGAVKSSCLRLSMKACFLLSSILGPQENKAKAMEAGVLEQLAMMVRQPTDPAAGEHIAAALFALMDGYPKAIERCQEPQLGMKKTLEERLQAVQSDPACQEEKDHLEKLLKMCWPE